MVAQGVTFDGPPPRRPLLIPRVMGTRLGGPGPRLHPRPHVSMTSLCPSIPPLLPPPPPPVLGCGPGAAAGQTADGQTDRRTWAGGRRRRRRRKRGRRVSSAPWLCASQGGRGGRRGGNIYGAGVPLMGLGSCYGARFSLCCSAPQVTAPCHPPPPPELVSLGLAPSPAPQHPQLP